MFVYISFVNYIMIKSSHASHFSSISMNIIMLLPKEVFSAICSFQNEVAGGLDVLTPQPLKDLVCSSVGKAGDARAIYSLPKPSTPSRD